MEGAKKNTDRELWREGDRVDDHYANSIHVTEGGGIGIDCGGHVIVKPLSAWHALAARERPKKVMGKMRLVQELEFTPACPSIWVPVKFQAWINIDSITHMREHDGPYARTEVLYQCGSSCCKITVADTARNLMEGENSHI